MMIALSSNPRRLPWLIALSAFFLVAGVAALVL